MKFLFLFVCFVFFGASFCEDPQTVNLRVMSYNIRLENDSPENWNKRRPVIAALIMSMDPDIIALQGFSRNSTQVPGIDQMKDLEREIFNKTGKQFSGNVVFVKKSEKHQGVAREVERGVAILMKWSRIEPGTFTKISTDTPLLYVNGTDRPADSKDSLDNFHQLHLFTTELRSPNDRKPLIENALLAMEKKTNWTWIPTVFLGDFGVVDPKSDPNENSMAALTQPSSASNRYSGDFSDVFKVYSKMLNHTQHTSPSVATYKESRSDRIYIRGNISVVTYEVLPVSGEVSEHHPILADLTLYTPPPLDDDNGPPVTADTNGNNTNANSTISVPTGSPKVTDSAPTTTTPTPSLEPGSMDVSKSVVILTVVFGVIVVAAVGVAIYYFRSRKANGRKEYFKPLEFDRFSLTSMSKDGEIN